MASPAGTANQWDEQGVAVNVRVAVNRSGKAGGEPVISSPPSGPLTISSLVNLLRAEAARESSGTRDARHASTWVATIEHDVAVTFNEHITLREQIDRRV